MAGAVAGAWGVGVDVSVDAVAVGTAVASVDAVAVGAVASVDALAVAGVIVDAEVAAAWVDESVGEIDVELWVEVSDPDPGALTSALVTTVPLPVCNALNADGSGAWIFESAFWMSV